MSSKKKKEKRSSVLMHPMLLGIFGLVFGLFLLVGQQGAGLLVGVGVCLYLLIDGALETIEGLALRGRVGTTVGLIRGIIGVAFAVVILILAFGLDVLGYNAGFNILAIGLIAYGALGIFASFFERGAQKLRWGPIAVNALLLVWGILIFVARAQDFVLQTWSAIILIALGVIGIAYAWFTRDGEPDELETA